MSAERNRSLVSATAVMAAGTLISRVLGFGRVALLAYLFASTTNQANGFELAMSVSTGLYFLIAGGALNTVLVPQIVRAIKNDPDGGSAFVSRVATAILTILAAAAIVLTVATPLVMLPYTSAQWLSPELAPHWRSVLLIGYLMMPQIFFYGLYVVLGQVLNARGKFGPMMWAPIVNNVVSIGVLIAYLLIWGRPADPNAPFSTAEALLLGIGGLAGIVAQALVMIPFVRGTGLRLRPRFDWKGAGLGHTFRLSFWTLIYMTVSQIGVMIATNLTSADGLAAYNRARLLWQVPHSMITVSLATAMLPAASRLAADDDPAGVAAEGMRTQKLATTVLLPAAVAFAALALPICQLLFGSGNGAEDYGVVAWSLVAACVGVVPFTIQYICLRLYYALEDTRTPALQQVLIVGVNIVLAIALVSLPQTGPGAVAPAVALAYSLAYVVGVVVSWRSLARRLPGLSAAELIRHLVRLSVCALPAGIVAFGIGWFGRGLSTSVPSLALIVALGGALGGVVFLALARLLHVTEVFDIVNTLLRRRARPAAAEPAEPAQPPLTTQQPPEPATIADTMDDPKTVLVPRITAPLATSAPLVEQPLAPGSFGVPDAPSNDALDDTAEDEHPIPIAPGWQLGGRYRLDTVLARRLGSQTWTAWDSVLGRNVVVHVLAHDDPEAAAVMAAARTAAIATDSRFLRVLDMVDSEVIAGPGPLPELGESARISYAVAEYVDGATLQQLLADGPLTAVESAWLLREVADALAGIHALGLSHQRINPSTVIVTRNGNIKIAGLLTEASLRPEDDGLLDGSSAEARRRDVYDLGRILYASVLCRWPDGPAYGLAQAPRSAGHWLTPRQVRAGVSPVLDELADRMLNPTPRQRKQPLTDAAEVAAELTRVLAGADGAADLERRVRGDQLPTTVGAFGDEDGYGPMAPPADPVEPRRRTTLTAAPATGAAIAKPPSRYLRIIVPAVLALLFVTVIALVRLLGGSPAPAERTEAAAPPPEPQRHAIAGARDFDPQGDDGTENPDQVKNAIDGDPNTAWRTLNYYNNPKLGGAKRGVGIIVDLGEPRPISDVTVLLFPDGGTDVELRVPKTESAGGPPMRTDADWRTVASRPGAEGETDFAIDPAVQSRYLLVYLTKLPRDGEHFRGSIYEVEVSG